MACWDSDRLDLPRIFGVRVRPEWLGTPTARDPATVTWATQRAKERAFPWRGNLLNRTSRFSEIKSSAGRNYFAGRAADV